MGARAARITRDELLTPPEFRGLRRPSTRRPGSAAPGSSWSARATRPVWGPAISRSRSALMPPFHLDSEPASLLYLINLTAGLMDGDGHLIEITARAGHAGRRDRPVGHPRPSGPGSYATQQWAVEVEDDACLVVLPGPDDPVPRQPLLPARSRRARPARPADLGRYLAGRPLRPRRALGAVPVRADRPGLRGPSRRPAGLSRPLPMGRPLDRRGRRLVFRRGPGLRQPVRRRARARGSPSGRSGPPALASSGSTRRNLHPMVRPSGRPSRPTWYRTPCVWPRTGPIGPEAPPWLLASSGLAPNHWFSTPVGTTSIVPMTGCEPGAGRQNLTRKLIPPVNWLRSVCAPLTPKAAAPAKSPRISGRISRYLTGCQLMPRVTSA